jgi:nucleotide-binding universal stress UspA family protein
VRRRSEMISIRKILFPTDFSVCADAALAWSVMLAQGFDSELIMFHAVVLHGDDAGDEVYSRFPDLEKVNRAREQSADSKLGKAISGIDKLVVRQKVRRGFSAPDEIINYAREEKADLIVLGTHGRKGLQHLLLGSVAERVVRFADCPVLAVRCLPDRPRREVVLNRIVLPVDFSAHNDRAARYATVLAASLGAEIEVVHVFTRGIPPTFYSIGKESIFEVDTGLVGRAEQAINDFMRRAGVEKPYRTTLVEGRPAEEIAKAAAKGDCSLVVMSSHGAGAVERMLIGSTTERVLRLAECPVLVIKPGEREFVK